MTVAQGPSTLILACGALARELLAVRDANSLDTLTVECLPASLHHTPALIPNAVKRRLETAVDVYDRVLVGYADCGTAGALDEVCEQFGATRLPGAHCFEFFAGANVYDELQEQELGTFYLTDFLARHFDRFVLDALGITDHPELEALYFGNYTRMIYLSQVPTDELLVRAEAAAARLGLDFEHRPSGYGELQPVTIRFADRSEPSASQDNLITAAGRSVVADG